jgi:hypothetical protein
MEKEKKFEKRSNSNISRLLSMNFVWRKAQKKKENFSHSTLLLQVVFFIVTTKKRCFEHFLHWVGAFWMFILRKRFLFSLRQKKTSSSSGNLFQIEFTFFSSYTKGEFLLYLSLIFIVNKKKFQFFSFFQEHQPKS